MTKLHKKVRANEDFCKKLHSEMNMHVAPTRLEAMRNFPAYIIPDLDPIQKQMNKIENTINRETRYARRRSWRKAK